MWKTRCRAGLLESSALFLVIHADRNDNPPPLFSRRLKWSRKENMANVMHRCGIWKQLSGQKSQPTLTLARPRFYDWGPLLGEVDKYHEKWSYCPRRKRFRCLTCLINYLPIGRVNFFYSRSIRLFRNRKEVSLVVIWRNWNSLFPWVLLHSLTLCSRHPFQDTATRLLAWTRLECLKSCNDQLETFT